MLLTDDLRRLRRRQKSHMSTLSEKSNFCPKIQFWQNPNIFTSFSPKFFWQFFSWNQSCQQLKSPKPQHFHEFFTQKNRQFSREIKVEFLDKKWRFRTVCKASNVVIFVLWWKIHEKSGSHCHAQNESEALQKILHTHSIRWLTKA